MISSPVLRSFAAALLLLGGLTACGPASVTGQDVEVAVAPPSALVAPGSSLTFAAAITGTVDTTVVWDVVEVGGGTVDASGRYTAPGQAGVYHVRAKSKADATKEGAATVTVTAPTPPPPPVAVSVAPATSGVDACKTLALTATVTGTTNGAVTWTVAEGAAGGAVTAAGVYTAPAVAGTYHAVATSQADPSKAASATIVVTERVLSVAVSPATIALPTSGSATFVATVTTTCGSTTSTGTLSAAAALSAN